MAVHHAVVLTDTFDSSTLAVEPLLPSARHWRLTAVRGAAVVEVDATGDDLERFANLLLALVRPPERD